jgi:hypothetical protein
MLHYEDHSQMGSNQRASLAQQHANFKADTVDEGIFLNALKQ